MFDTPDDRLVWDVGHQTYGHKILTGRRDGMRRAAPEGRHRGLPAPRGKRLRHLRHRALLDLDLGGARHGGGGAQPRADDHRVVAVIGDGAMTAGMAFEALNNAKQADANVIVVLNDNDMSISENVGALNNYLAKLMSGRFYAATQQDRREGAARSRRP